MHLGLPLEKRHTSRRHIEAQTRGHPERGKTETEVDRQPETSTKLGETWTNRDMKYIQMEWTEVQSVPAI